VLVHSNSSLPHPEGVESGARSQDPTLTAQCHVLDTQTGRLIYAWQTDPSTQPAARSVSITAHGEYVAVANGASDINIFVLDVKNKKQRCDPIDVGLSLETVIDATGTWLVDGYQNAAVMKWDASSSTYQTQFTIPGLIDEGQFELYSAAISSNNGKPLIALGWTDSQAIGVRVDLVKTDGTKLWTYVGPLNAQDQNIVSAMSMHLNYVAVTTWGSYDETSNKSPQVLVFNDKSNHTVFDYITPGSMFAVDLYVQRATKSDTINVIAAGKHVHANTFGNGGDLFVFTQKA
jgi:hypothetical protein